MSRVSELTRAVKATTNWYGIWRKTSTAKCAKTISENIFSYLDESSKTTRSTIFGVTKQKPYEYVAFGAPEAQLAGIDYLTKEETGKVRVYGFLRDDIFKMLGMQPHRLDNDTRVVACHSAWLQRMEAKKGARKFGHKYVLSLDPRFCELMAAAGKDVDAFLIQGLRTVLRRYQEKYYPGDQLGYLAGIHHDRKHIHAHALLFPFTQNGKNLNVSNRKGDRRLQSMIETANKFVRDYFDREFEFPIRASERPLDRVIQHRLIASYLIEEYSKLSPSPQGALAWLAREQKRIMSLPEPELRDILTKAYGTESAHHAEMLKQIDDDPTAAERLVQAIEPTVTRIRHSLQKAYERTKDAHAWMTKLREETDLAYKACANYKFYLNKSRGGMAVGSGLPLLDEESPTHRAWLTKALLEQGTGDRLEAALQELDRRREPSWQLMRNGAVNVIAAMKAQGMLLSPWDRLEKRETNQFIRSSQDFMRCFYLQRLENLKNEREKLKAELEEYRLRREGARLMLEGFMLHDLEVRAAVKGRRPLFLEQFEGIKRAGITLPVVCRSREADLCKRHALKGNGAFDDLNRRILETLRAFQGDTSKEALLEVDSYFREILVATAGRTRPKSHWTVYSKSANQHPLVGVPAQAGTVDSPQQGSMQVDDREFEL